MLNYIAETNILFMFLQTIFLKSKNYNIHIHIRNFIID
jgi:hypothetical protein